MTAESQFWTELNFATDSPKLYQEIADFRQWIGVRGHLPDHLEHTLRHYFGMNNDQVDAWMRWYMVAFYSKEDAKANMLKTHAIDLTLNHGAWPARFEMHRHDIVEEE